MKIEFTEHRSEHSRTLHAIHASNGAILATGPNEVSALLNILEDVRRTLVVVGDPDSAKTLKRATDRIKKRLDAEGKSTAL